jgi:N-acyl-L-homoserine lactone synthetase
VADDPVAIADRVAETALAAVPQRLATAASDAERDAVFRLRYRTVVEMGWARPEELPDGIERNDDDDGAIHVIAWNGDDLAGAARIVLPCEGKTLPLVREFGVQVNPEDVEVGRTIIVPHLRGDAHHALVVALYAQCWLEMRSRGFTELVSAVPPRLVEVYRALGFNVIELGPAQEHWGEPRFPVRFDVIGSLPELQQTLLLDN